MEVFVAYEKHGTSIHAQATTILNRRIREGYWYDDETVQNAMRALIQGEEAAWQFLDSRSDHEYEAVERQLVEE